MILKTIFGCILGMTFLVLSCKETRPHEEDGKKDELSFREAFERHDRAIYIHDSWIRDPYIYLHDDGYYYLTGTTPEPGDTREKQNPYNSGLDNPAITGQKKRSIVGYHIRVWRSQDLKDWEYVGEPFSLDQGYWAKENPDAFKGDSSGWRLWAPELYFVNGKWVFVHTTPEPVKGGANLAMTNGSKMNGPFSFPMGTDMKARHDPSLFKDVDNIWYLLWGNTSIAPITHGFNGLAQEPVRIDPADRVIGHEGATLRKIGGKYVHFGTAWSTDEMRKGSYNLYYCTSDSILGPYGKRQFAGRFLGHGTPFQDKQGRWWCTAFYNANVPPLSDVGIQEKDLSENAQTINEQGTTIVPLEVRLLENGEVFIRAKDDRYRNPGPDEATDYNTVEPYCK